MASEWLSMKQIHTDYIGLAALILVILSWIIFCVIFLLRKKAEKAQETKRDSAAKWGIALQGCGFALVWLIRRSYWWPFRGWMLGELMLAAVAVVLAYGSNWWCLRAVQTLGKQWTYAARVVEGHELITQGPYAVVRNPIYLGMFGLMVATGLVLCTWWALVLAIAFFLVGNEIRIRAEEKLLRETFGAKFEEYADRVPAFFPRLL
jgi:protein-S-isoprenylcysteine O-methyltransferase Ste14